MYYQIAIRLKMVIDKKSQAALEFLTTYAWAFVVIIIVIGAIAYFGILRPQKILPDRCNFNVGFDCQAYSFSSDGTFKLRLKNSVGHLVDVTDLNLITEAGSSFGCTISGAPPTGWRIGEVKDITWTSCDLVTAGFAAGEKAKVLVNMTYYDPKAGASYAKLAEGEIFTAIT